MGDLEPIIPVLRQSLVEVMSCPKSYETQVIESRTMPSGLQSARGTEIHKVMSLYVRHCWQRKVPADWEAFDRIALGVGVEAAEILDGMRDSYLVDFEHVYDTELKLAWASYEGTLDVLLFPTPGKAEIKDYKSHPRPFDCEKTFQAKFYPLLVFLAFPEVEEVEFEYVFVRYSHCTRSVTYTRSDVPKLRQIAESARKRQREIHERYLLDEPNPAYPGRHCQYCPLLQSLTACPISEFNPQAQPSLEERARFAVWLGEVKKVNDQVLHDAVDATGQPVRFSDANGRVTEIGYNPHESFIFPAVDTMLAINDYIEATPDDAEWVSKLVLGASKLKQYLKAKKRSFLHQHITDSVAVPVSKPKFEISHPVEQIEDTEEVYASDED